MVLEPDLGSSFLAALSPVRPVMAWSDWVRNSLGKTMIHERAQDVRTFFADADPQAQHRVLDRYRVRWVWVPHDVVRDPPPEAGRVLGNADGELWRVDLKPTASPGYFDRAP